MDPIARTDAVTVNGAGVDSSRARDPADVSEIGTQCPGVGRGMIRLILRQLRDEGLVASSGVGRSAKWRRTN